MQWSYSSLELRFQFVLLLTKNFIWFVSISFCSFSIIDWEFYISYLPIFLCLSGEYRYRHYHQYDDREEHDYRYADQGDYWSFNSCPEELTYCPLGNLDSVFTMHLPDGTKPLYLNQFNLSSMVMVFLCGIHMRAFFSTVLQEALNISIHNKSFKSILLKSLPYFLRASELIG